MLTPRAAKSSTKMVEDELQLQGWSKKRRVVIVRQRIRGGIARERRVQGQQLRLDLAGASVHEGERLWEYAVIVTDVPYPLEAIGQLYRDRADCENGFDELKNQWGLSGFTIDRWGVLLRYVCDKIAPALGPFRLLSGPPSTG